MTKNCCGSCGNCRDNGRLWIEGYHGKKSLNYNTDSAIIKNVAAFEDFGFNLSECCAPVLRVTPKNLTDQLLNPVLFSESRLTDDPQNDNFILNDVYQIISEGSQILNTINFNKQGCPVKN